MHHQDFSADPTGTGSRKSSFHYRRGSSGASASSGAGAPDDNIPTQTGSSSPGLHHHQQQQHQPQSQAAGGAQVKKKSGFQITSVTSAQISGNNSLADDTESYDDMDESHTEDLSSSEMLDVSMSRATDTGVPERSSSDETLNSLHGFDTPGIVSPNEPLHPHSIPQGSQQHASMVNGTVPHHYYPPPPAPQQHSQPHHHHSDSLGGGEPQVPALPVTPLASSSPALTSKAGINQSQMPSMLDKSAGGTIQPPAADLQGGVNISSVSAVPAAPPSGPAGFDTTSGASGQVASTGGGTATAAAAATQPQQTQTATGSRFRVVKLDTNSEPFRKGRWTCTEYYEKEIPHAATSETLKGAEAAAEAEAGGGGGVGVSPGPAAVQPPHTLQPYPPPSQDFTSPQAMQSPPQGPGPAQATPLSYVSPQEAAGAAHMPQPVAPVALLPAVPQVTPQVTAQVTPQVGVNQPLPVMPQLLPYAGQPQAGYPAPQLLRQPDFIQPTAPFQTQVQPPPPHVTTGISMTTGAGVTAQPPVSITQQLPLQGQAAPPALATFPPQSFPVQPQQHLPQAQAHPPSTAPAPPTQGVPYMPLTALQADLQPLLTPGATLTHSAGGSSLKSSHLEGAQKLLFQHQGLLGLPRLGGSASREGAAEAGITAGSLAHMGMSAEASAFMAAAAAGLRTQHADGDEDSSSGTSVVAIDNKIEQAMDLVKSHLMYAVREEVEVLKEQIKELIERNSQLEQENNLLKTLASPEQMAQFQAQVQTGGSPTGAAQPPVPGSVGTTQQALPPAQNSGMSA